MGSIQLFVSCVVRTGFWQSFSTFFEEYFFVIQRVIQKHAILSLTTTFLFWYNRDALTRWRINFVSVSPIERLAIALVILGSTATYFKQDKRSYANSFLTRLALPCWRFTNNMRTLVLSGLTVGSPRSAACAAIYRQKSCWILGWNL